MSRWVGGAGILLVIVLSMAFASLNGGQRVTLRLGFATFYGVPVTVVVFGSVVVGMLIMLVAGIHSDLKVRRILRTRLAQEAEEERDRFVDRSQKDLFEEPASPTGETEGGDQPGEA
ncbi:MAG: hypothetical protein ACE5GJ_11825 [Gemmatimonadota bacterium]